MIAAFYIKRIKNPILREVLDWTVYIAIAVVLGLLIVNYVAQIAVVSGSSMEPTLQNKNVLVTEKISENFGSIDRDDIVTLYVPEFLEEGKSLVVKRVIGIAGDTVEIGADGKLYVNSKPIEEKYINGDRTLTVDPQYTKVTVPKGYIYVLGDNRLPGASKDSRTFGPVKLDKVRGVVLLRLFPLNKFGSVK